MSSIALPYDLTLITQLIKEQEPPEPIHPQELRQRHKRQRGHPAQRQLHQRVVGPRVPVVAVAARKEKVGQPRHHQAEDHEHQPGEAGGVDVRLVNAHPLQPSSEAVELVVRVGGRPPDAFVTVGDQRQLLLLLFHDQGSLRGLLGF